MVGSQSSLNAANVSSQSSELRELVQRLPPPYGLSSGPRGPPINLAYDEEVVEEEPEIILEVLQSDSDSHTRRLWRRRRRSPSPTYHNRKMKRRNFSPMEQNPRPTPPDSAEKYFMETISSAMERKLNKKLRKLADHINDYI